MEKAGGKGMCPEREIQARIVLIYSNRGCRRGDKTKGDMKDLLTSIFIISIQFFYIY